MREWYNYPLTVQDPGGKTVRERQKRRVFRSVTGTVLLTAALLLSFAFFHHVLPLQLARRQSARQPVPTAAPVAVTPAPELSGETPGAGG